MNPFEEYLEMINTTENEWTSHSRNVGQLSTAFGSYTSLPYKKLVILKTGAYLHDIGKSKIPSKILYKQGKLTSREYDVIKQHPLLGYEAVIESSSLSQVTYQQTNQDVLDIILQHHERADGLGYPYGLRDQEINPLAKIVFLCDSFDAMISKRCYKDEFSVDYALSEIHKGLGSQFNADFGDKFIRFIQNEWNPKRKRLQAI